MAKKSLDNELVTTEFHAEWLNLPSPFDMLDDEWLSIIVFYVFHSPVSGVSARGKLLSDFQWGAKNRLSTDSRTLGLRLMKYAGMDEKKFQCVENNWKLRQSLSENGLIDFPKDWSDVRLTYYCPKKEDEKYERKYENLFRHIRNAFAHGRVALHDSDTETYIALEDVNYTNNEYRVTARMILSKSILLRWMRVIQVGPFTSEEELNKEFGIVSGHARVVRKSRQLPSLH